MGARPTLELLAASAGAAWWCLQAEAVPTPATWVRVLPLTLVSMPVVRAALSGVPGTRMALAAGSALIATALVPFPVASDHVAAISKLWMMIGALGLAASLSLQPSARHLRTAAALFTAGAAGFSLYFIATNDWFAVPVKFPLIAALGQALARWLPAPAGSPRIHPNVVAGVLAALLPLAVPVWDSTHRSWLRTAAASAAAITALGLVLTASRAAWLATAVVWITWAVVGAQVGRRPERRAHRWFAVAVAVGALMGAAVLIGFPDLLANATSASGRLAIQARARVLAQDYPVVGAGLASLPMQLALYADVSAVRSAAHAHNLFLDVLIEQGWIGLAACLALMALTVRFALRARHDAHPALSQLADATLASQAVMLIHGLLDDTIYASRGIIVLFVPCGFALAAAALVAPDSRSRLPWPSRRTWIASTVLIVIAAAIVTRPAIAAWHANLGALDQSRAELAAYDPAKLTERSIDDVRRTVDLERAMARFGRAQQIAPGHPTASRRLTMILLARGAYGDALRESEAAWHAGHRDVATRALLGDALVANGRVDEAVRLLEGQPLAAERLKSQAWYRYWTGGDFERAADAWMAAARLDPADRDAREWAEVARARARGQPTP